MAWGQPTAGQGHGPANLGGGRPPMKVTSSCTEDANPNTHPLTHTPEHHPPIVPYPHASRTETLTGLDWELSVE